MPDQTSKDPTPDDGRPERSAPGAEGAGQRPAGAATRAVVPSSSGGGRFWLIPAATFLIGLLLGALVVGVSGSEDGSDAAGGSPPSATQTAVTPTVGPSTRPAATVTVPGSCLDVADSTEALLGLVEEATAAAQDLNASELSSIVRQLQESQAGLQQQSSACRSAASSAVGSSSTGG